MKAAALTIVRNELDILEAWVRYHAEIVDHLVVADHRSIDGSAELLEELAAEGLPLTVRPLTSPLFHQGQTMTELIWQTSAELDPDLFVLLDADEFLGTDEPQSVRELVSMLSREGPTSVAIRHYVPTPEDDPTDRNPLTRIVHRRPLGDRTKRKVIVPRIIASDRTYGVSNGNHHVVTRGSRAECPAEPSSTLFIAHYPARSVEQVAAKVVGWFAGRIARPDRVPKLNPTKRRIISQLARKGPPADDWLMDVGLSYCMAEERKDRPELVRAPLSPAPSLRYPTETSVSVLGILADALEDIAEVIQHERKATAQRAVANLADQIQALGNLVGQLEQRTGDFPPQTSPSQRTGNGQRRDQTDRLRRKLASSQREIEVLEVELKRIQESKTWRFTAPLRGLGARRGSGG